MLDYFGGVIYWTGELEPMVQFYRDVLELPVHSIHPDFVAFELGGIRISVGAHSEVRGPAPDGVRVMINLGVEDIFATFEALRKHGVGFIRPPEREEWGGWVATFSDPDGNLLQLLQQPPTPGHQGDARGRV
ncbi:MAG TPA: VOC family protein [Dehalococcoidia bacterium]|nr:VOC family protein [Dehalococcoidia bacterium]